MLTQKQIQIIQGKNPNDLIVKGYSAKHIILKNALKYKYVINVEVIDKLIEKAYLLGVLEERNNCYIIFNANTLVEELIKEQEAKAETKVKEKKVEEKVIEEIVENGTFIYEITITPKGGEIMIKWNTNNVKSSKIYETSDYKVERIIEEIEKDMEKLENIEDNIEERNVEDFEVVDDGCEFKLKFNLQ